MVEEVGCFICDKCDFEDNTEIFWGCDGYECHFNLCETCYFTFGKTGLCKEHPYHQECIFCYKSRADKYNLEKIETCKKFIDELIEKNKSISKKELKNMMELINDIKIDK